MVRIHHTYNLRLCGSYIPFPCCRTPVASALRLLHCRRAVRVAHQKIEEGQQFQANFLVQTPRISLPAHWQFLWPSEHAGGLSRQWELRRQPLLICCVIRREMNANTVWCWCTRHRKTANKHQTSRTQGKGLVCWCRCHNIRNAQHLGVATRARVMKRERDADTDYEVDRWSLQYDRLMVRGTAAHGNLQQMHILEQEAEALTQAGRDRFAA